MSVRRSAVALLLWSAVTLPAVPAVDVSDVAGGGRASTLALLSAEQAAPELTLVFDGVLQALAADPAVTVVAREDVARMLREQEISLQGLMRRPVRYGSLLGAELILYGQTETKDSEVRVRALCLDVRTGNVVAERGFTLARPLQPAATSSAVTEALALIRDGIATIRRHEDSPTASVLSVANRSDSRRLNFVEEKLRRLVEEQLEELGYYLLRREKPGVLAGETALSAAGMVRPNAEVLAAAADTAVWATFVEQPDYELAQADTPIALRVTVRRSDRTQDAHEMVFTLAAWDTLESGLRSCLPAPATDCDELSREDACAEAARLMTELRSQMRQNRWDDAFWSKAEAARRIIYLDPTIAEAYLILAESLDWQDPIELREKLDMYVKYLEFPREDRTGVRQAFFGILRHGAWQFVGGREAEYVRWMREYAEWANGECRQSRFVTWAPDDALQKWWQAHPLERLAYYERLQELAGDKPHGGICPLLEMAKCHDQLDDPTAAAQCAYRAVTEHRVAPRFCRENGYDVLRWLNGLVPARQAEALAPEPVTGHRAGMPLRGQVSGVEDCYVPSVDEMSQARALFEERDDAYFEHDMAALYGVGGAKSLWDYQYRADADRLRRRNYPRVAPRPIRAGAYELSYAAFLQPTASGLWLRGLDVNGRTVLLHSIDGRGWSAVETPDGFARRDIDLIDVVECDGTVLFATSHTGCWAYRPNSGQWRHLDMTQGLPSDNVGPLWVDHGRKEVWISAGTFLAKFADDRLQGYRQVIPSRPAAMCISDGCGVVLSFDGLLFRLDRDRQDLIPIPYDSEAPEAPAAPACYLSSIHRNYNSADLSQMHARMAVRGSDLYFATRGGIVATDPRGRAKQWAYPSAFCFRGELGAWVEGNCALPECRVTHVVADDRDENLIWVVSHHNAYGFGYEGGFRSVPRTGNPGMDSPDDARGFITAFNTQTRTFSTPREITEPFANVQPWGDTLMLTGKGLRCLPKSIWVPSSTATDVDAASPVEMEPTCLMSRVSREALRGNEPSAIEMLDSQLQVTETNVSYRLILARLYGTRDGLYDPGRAAQVLRPLLSESYPRPLRMRAAFDSADYFYYAGRLSESIAVVQPFLSQYMNYLSRPPNHGPDLYDMRHVWAHVYRGRPAAEVMAETRDLARLCNEYEFTFLKDVATYLGMPDEMDDKYFRSLWQAGKFSQALGQHRKTETSTDVSTAEFFLEAGDPGLALRILDGFRSLQRWDAWQGYEPAWSPVYAELIRHRVLLLGHPTSDVPPMRPAIQRRVDVWPELAHGLTEWDRRLEMMATQPNGLAAFRESLALAYRGLYEQALSRIKAMRPETVGDFAYAEGCRLGGIIEKYSLGRSGAADRHFQAAAAAYMRAYESTSDGGYGGHCLYLAARTGLLRGRPDRAAFETVIRRYPASEAAESARRDLAGLVDTNTPPVLCHGIDDGRPVRPGAVYGPHDVLVLTLPEAPAVDMVLYRDGLDFVWSHGRNPLGWDGRSLHWPGARPRPGMGYLDFLKDGKFVTRRFYHFFGRIANEAEGKQ